MSNFKVLVVTGMALATPALASSKLISTTGPDGTTVEVPPMAGSERHAAPQTTVGAGPVTAIYDGSSVPGMTCDLIEIGASGWYAIPLVTNHGFALALDSLSTGLPFAFSPGILLPCGFSSGGWYQATSIYIGTPR